MRMDSDQASKRPGDLIEAADKVPSTRTGGQIASRGMRDFLHQTASSICAVLVNAVSPLGLAIFLGAGCPSNEIMLTAMFFFLSVALAAFVCQHLGLQTVRLLGSMCLLVCMGAAWGVVFQGGTSLGIYINMLFSGMSAMGLVASLRLFADSLQQTPLSDRIAAYGSYVTILTVLMCLEQVLCMAVTNIRILVALAAAIMLAGAISLLTYRLAPAAAHNDPERISAEISGGEPVESGFGLLIRGSFVTFGLGTACYLGAPFMVAYENAGAGATREPIWWTLILSLGVFAIAAAAIIVKFAPESSSKPVYGRVVRLITPECATLAPLAIIAHTHLPLLGSVLLPMLPVIAAWSLAIMVLQVQDHIKTNIVIAALQLMGDAALGAVAGLIVILALWQVGDVMLRYQFLALLMVVTCVWEIPNIPRKTVSGSELVKREFSEDLSGEQRLERRVAEVAAQGSLTPRESQVLELLVRAKSHQEISTELGMSLRTAQNHVASIHRKLDVHSVGELMRLVGEYD